MGSLRADPYPLPVEVSEISAANSSGGVSGVDGISGFAWLFSRSQLLVWQYAEGPLAKVFRHTLPYPTASRHIITVVTYQGKADVTVLMCSEEGNITVWPSFLDPNAVPMTERATKGVTAFTAARAPGDGFIGVAGTASGTMHTVLSVAGPALDVKPLGDSSRSQSRGIISRWMSSTWEGAPAGVQVLQLLPVPGKPGLLRLAVLRNNCVECWQLSGEGDRMAWRYPLLQQLQQADRAASVRLLDLSLVDGPDGRGVIVVLSSSTSPASAMDESLAVHVLTEGEGGAAPSVRSVKVTGVTGDFRCLPSLEADAFLFWKPRALACAWSSAVGPLWIDSHGNCLAASVSADGESWLILTQQAGVVTTAIAPSRPPSADVTPSVSAVATFDPHPRTAGITSGPNPTPPSAAVPEHETASQRAGNQYKVPKLAPGAGPSHGVEIRVADPAVGEEVSEAARKPASSRSQRKRFGYPEVGEFMLVPQPMTQPAADATLAGGSSEESVPQTAYGDAHDAAGVTDDDSVLQGPSMSVGGSTFSAPNKGVARELRAAVPGEAGRWKEGPNMSVTLEQVSEVLQEASTGRSPPDLRARLEGLGAFSGSGRSNLIARFSTRIVDALPKQWGSTTGGGSILEQLADKLRRHNNVLRALATECLPCLDAPTLRVLFENGEQLAGLEKLREAENRLIPGASAPLPLQEAVEIAGGWVASELPEPVVGSRPNLDIFFGSPSLAALRFFQAVAHLAASEPPVDAPGAPPPAAARFKRLAAFVSAIQAMVAGAGAQRSGQQHCCGPAAAVALRGAGGPDWLSQQSVRDCLSALTLRAISLKEAVASEAPERLPEHCQLMLDVAELLLNAFAAAQAAADPTTSARDLALEYGDVRSRTLRHLTLEAIQLCQSGSPAGPGVLRRSESLAEAHHAYEQLLDICLFVRDPERLYNHMVSLRDPMGAVLGAGRDLYGHDSCAAYVFSRLLAEDKKGELLSMPDKLNGLLKDWLVHQEPTADVLEVRALHELRLRDYLGAAASYTQLGATSGNTEAARSASCMARLCGLAAAPDGLRPPPPQVVASVEEAQGLAALLDVQEALGLGGGPVLPPRALLGEALKDACPPGALVLAVDVFAAAGPAFRIENMRAMDEVWARLAAATDWEALSAERSFVSDEQYIGLLAATPLARAAHRCFTPFVHERAVCIGGRMEDTVSVQHVAGVLGSIPCKGALQMQAAFELGLQGAAAEIDDGGMLMT